MRLYRFKRFKHVFVLSVWLMAVLLLLPAAPAGAGELVRAGVYDNPPKVFITRNGTAAGLYPDILNAMARERGWTLQFVPGTWQECLDRLKSQEIDLLVDIGKTKEREALFSFSEEVVITNWGAVYTGKNSFILSFEDLKDRTVAVVSGDVYNTGDRGIRGLLSSLDISCRFVEVGSYADAMMLVDSAQVDACVVNRLFGILNEAEYDVTTTPLIFSPMVLLFAAPRDGEHSQALLDQIDQSLRKYKQDPDSVYHKAMGHYMNGGRIRLDMLKDEPLPFLDLSFKEKQWVRDHPVVKFSTDPYFSPFESLSQDGRFTGIAADYLELIHKKTGLNFQRIGFNTWGQAVKAARSRQIDMLPCLADTPGRQPFLSFTNPYIQFSRVIITTLDSPLCGEIGLSGLSGLKVGVQADRSCQDALTHDTGITVVSYPTFLDALVSVSSKKVDAAIGNLAVASHDIKKLSLTNLKIAGYADPEPQSLSMGIRKDWPELAGILNRALASVSFREKDQILSKWLPLPLDSQKQIQLTDKEREWLLMNPRIRVAWDRHWAPLEFVDKDGAPQGVSMDYLNAISKMLGLEFDMGRDLGWPKIESKLEKKELDMCTCLAVTPKRLSFLKFTKPYLSLPVVIFSGKDMPYVRNLSEISKMKVAVVKDYAVDQWVSHDFPDLSLARVDTVKDGFALLEKKKVDAFLCNVLPGNYYLSRLKDHDIKIAGTTRYTYKLRMAVRKDWPELAGILEKALDRLPDAEKNYFYRKWALIKYEKGFDYVFFKKSMVVVLAVILVMLLWNRQMVWEVSQRRIAEATLAIREAQLKRTNRELKKVEALKDNLAHMMIRDMRFPLSVITGNLDLLESGLDQYPTVQKHLRAAREGAGMLNRMMRSFLDTFRLESNEMVLKPEKFDLKELAQTVLAEMKGLAEMNEQQLSLSGKSCMGYFDPQMIRKVLVNLVENGLKASPRGGWLEVFVGEVESCLMVEVKDSGNGIPVEFQDKIFDKFSRLEQGPKTAVPSYGLGLTFCKLAVEAHKGTIGVRNQDFGGSVFYFSLPGTGENGLGGGQRPETGNREPN